MNTEDTLSELGKLLLKIIKEETYITSCKINNSHYTFSFSSRKNEDGSFSIYDTCLVSGKFRGN